MTDSRKRAEALLRRMTLDEKIAQLHSIWLTLHEDGTLTLKTITGLTPSDQPEDPFEHIKNGIGQITRPLGAQYIGAMKGVRSLNRLQRFLVKETRLGIPALPHEECLAGLMAEEATNFPASIAIGASWDEDLVERVARAIAKEVRSVGSLQGLAPVLDVSRDARWGRTEETYGEDPYLAGSLATAYVRGLQNQENGVVATLKHYVGHSFSEGGRNHAPVRIGPRELADTFLLPFEMAVKLAHAQSVMPAYHDIDGEPLHESRKYITELLRDGWGFDGTIVSDYEGISQLHADHRTRRSIAEAAAAALQAGVDVEFPNGTVYARGLKAAVEEGILDTAAIDASALRVLRQKFELGLFENPYVDEGAVELNSPESRALAKEAADKSIVLLKNDGALPLKSDANIALIGPLGDDRLGMLSGYAYPVHHVVHEVEENRSEFPTLKEELEKRSEGRIVYHKGCDILSGRPKESVVFPGEIGMEGAHQTSNISYDESGIAEAVEAARSADTIVLAVGDLPGLFLSGTVGEGSDTTSLELPGVQMKLLDAVLDLGKPVAVVVMSGRPYNLERGFDQAAAVVQAWLPGEAGGAAIADVLYGALNPGGKLSVSIPHGAGAMPFFYNYKMKSAGTPIQREFGARYPFGFGLSYTKFELTEFQLEAQSVDSAGEIALSCSLTNVGDRPGDEVVQLYVRDLYASLVRPVSELKGFRRVHLEPAASAHLRFVLPCDMLSYTRAENERVVEPGEFEIMLGTSCKDIAFRQTITVTGNERILSARWRMQSEVTVHVGELAGTRNSTGN